MQRAVAATEAPGTRMTSSEFQPYLEATVLPALKEALADMCRLQPANPLGWLAARLLEPAPRGSNGINFTASEAGTSALALMPVQLLPVADESKDAVRIQELKAQVRDLNARLTADASSVGSFSGPQAPFQISMQSPSALSRDQDSERCSRSIALSALRRDQAHMRAVFERHKDVDNRMSKDALIAALQEVDAPVVIKECDAVFRLADTNMDGFVDFDEFIRVAQLPDDLEKLLQRHNLSLLAPALRALHHFDDDDPLKELARFSENELNAAVEASIESMKQELLKVHDTSRSASIIRDESEKQKELEPHKYQIRKMPSSTLAEFREGLASRIGPPNPNFEVAMAAEHCSLGGCDKEFTSGQYRITTTPRKEWMCIVGDENGQRQECPADDMHYGRHIVSIDEHMQRDRVVRVGLNRAEVIALVMYGGPMWNIYGSIMRRYPLNTYEEFEQAGNRFASTIFALASAVVKLSRVERFGPATKLYRGLGGTLQLPDSFYEPDEFGTRGYVESGFVLCSADLEVAMAFSGAKQEKPIPTVMVIEVGTVDRPCDTSDFSQYPGKTERVWPPFSVVQPSGDSWVELYEGCAVTMIPVRVTVSQFETVEQIQERKRGEHMNSFRSVISNTIRKLEREASDPDITEQQRAHTVVNMEEISAQMQAVLKKHQQLDIQHFVDDRLYRDVMTEMLNSTELTFMGRFILKGDQHEYKSATCAVFIATDVEGDTKRPVALKFMKNASEFEQEKSSRLKLKEAAAYDFSSFVVDITQSFDCSHEPFKQSLNSGSNFVINSNLQLYPSLIVMPAADRNMRAIMDNERITDPAVIKRMYHEILRAVKFMHGSGVIHGDIKPRNVVRVDGRLVIIDLDASAEIGKQYSWSKYSSAYLPPEAIDLTVAAGAAPAAAKVRRFASGGSNACACTLALTDAAHAAAFNDGEDCVGACGLAHRCHDMWALGVLLYRFSARESLFSENDDDNIKEDSGHLVQLAEWTPKFKDERLQKIDDTATRKLVAQLLQRDPRMRPASIDDVLAMPFNEMDVIKAKLEQMVKHDDSRSSNLVGSVKDLRTGKFSDAAHGLRSYLKVADSWDERAACQLQGVEDEVDALKDCPDCAQVQAAALLQLHRKEASTTVELEKALALLRQQRHQGHDTQAAADAVKALRSQLSAAGGWHYGLPNTIEWPKEWVQVTLGTFVKTFCQPMCKGCQDYCLDYSSIMHDLNYIMREAAVEQKCWNGVRDAGRAGQRLQHLMQAPQAREAKLTEAELVCLRLYTSHSFESINKPLRDMDRVAPHPLPGIVTNIQEGLKKLRTLGANDASSKQTVVLWRGMSAMKFSDEFSTEGGTELAPMSTTTDVSVAISYAVKKDTRSALLFRFVTRNNLERGADVQWLSMFPGESETLFPPLTFIQKTRSDGRVVQHDGVTVSVVELSTSFA